MAGDGGAEPALADEPGEHLSRLVRSWRERLSPDSIAGFAASGRRKRIVSQEDLARLIGSSNHWYARLERGDTGIYSEDFLDRTARTDADRHCRGGTGAALGRAHRHPGTSGWQGGRLAGARDRRPIPWVSPRLGETEADTNIERQGI